MDFIAGDVLLPRGFRPFFRDKSMSESHWWHTASSLSVKNDCGGSSLETVFVFLVGWDSFLFVGTFFLDAGGGADKTQETNELAPVDPANPGQENWRYGGGKIGDLFSDNGFDTNAYGGINRTKVKVIWAAVSEEYLRLTTWAADAAGNHRSRILDFSPKGANEWDKSDKVWWIGWIDPKVEVKAHGANWNAWGRSGSLNITSGGGHPRTRENECLNGLFFFLFFFFCRLQ
jgi:hypothetical protein